jgi:hypothetical protein
LNVQQVSEDRRIASDIGAHLDRFRQNDNDVVADTLAPQAGEAASVGAVLLAEAKPQAPVEPTKLAKLQGLRWAIAGNS